MRTATTQCQPPVPLQLKPAAGFTRWLGRAMRRGWRTYWERRAQKATVFILHSLDERTLHDIGINPSEIESCVYSKWGDRRRPYNASWRC